MLTLEGTSRRREPYWKRRTILESLHLAGAHWSLVPSFEDAEGLWTVVEEQALEGVVAKPLRSVYRPGERGWLKVRNRAYWKCELEREAGARQSRGAGSFSCLPTRVSFPTGSEATTRT